MVDRQRVDVLARAPIFYGLAEGVLTRIAEVAQHVSADRGETFIREGDVEPWMYLLVSGQARVHSQDRTIATVEAGAMVGELAVLDPAPRSADVTATEPCVLLRVDHAPFADLMTEEPELVDSVVAMLVRLVRATSDRDGPTAVSTV